MDCGDDLGVAQDQLAILDRAQLDVVGPQRDDLAVLRADDLAGERQDGGQVGRDAGEALAEADHHAGAFLDGVQPVFVRRGR